MKYLFLSVFLLFSACGEKKELKSFDGEKLLEQKCASCHNLEMPPVVFKDELAPPMMAVAFHVHSFVKPSDESQRTSKAIEFVVDYVANPSIEKSFCDKESLQRYGLMPSQKNSVNNEETKAIASYMFKHYTPKHLAKIQKGRALYEALPVGEKIARKENCLSCHRKEIDLVGPSFLAIAKKYNNNRELISKSIHKGSVGKWKKNAVMPAFKHLDEKDVALLVDWILEVKE